MSLVTTGLVPLGKALAVNPSPPFTQCPPVGLDTSCALLIIINPGGTLTILQDPSQGPYDGIEDTLIGVLNQSGAPATSMNLSSSVNAFGFDGDGICSFFTPGPPACPYGPTGYEGPNTSFSNIGGGGTTGTVNFPATGGLANGASTYFSLEEQLTPQQLNPCNPTFTPTKTISGPVNGNVIISQPTVIDGATITGNVVIKPGVDVLIKNSTINGTLTSDLANSVAVSNSTIKGSSTINRTVGATNIGQVGSCSGNFLANLYLDKNSGPVNVANNTTAPGGSFRFSNNTGGTTVQANVIKGSLDCYGNTPPPNNNASPNTVSGQRTQQCRTPVPL